MRREIFLKYEPKLDNLLPILHEIQDNNPQHCLTEEDLIMVAKYLNTTYSHVKGVATFYSMFGLKPRGKYIIRVCESPACHLRGSTDILLELSKFLGIGIGETTDDGVFTLESTSCLGACCSAPVIMINDRMFGNFSPERISDELIRLYPSFSLDSRTFAQTPPKNGEVRVVLENFGIIDPESIDEYISAGGYEALRKAIFRMRPEDVVEEVKRSGLRGRGGAGFPTGIKWELARKGPGIKYVICNADEGEPGTFKDRLILEGDPHKLLEGMLITGYAIGASKGYIYIRGEYGLSIRRIQKAVDDARDAGLLGKNIMGSGFDFDVEIRKGAGAYICGEETALIESLEGKRGTPRIKPPYPVTDGLWECPTVVNNVETLANIPPILKNGADWFRGFGTPKSPGTKIYTVLGDVERPGAIELEMGTTLREIIFRYGEGIKDGKRFKAALVGGASGAFLTEKHLDLRMDFESLKEHNAILGSGAVLVMDEDTCILDMLYSIARFFEHESCGKCVPCRVGNSHLVEIIEKLRKSEDKGENIDKALSICDTMWKTSLCPLGQSLIMPVRSAIEGFRDELERHSDKNYRCMRCLR